MLTSGPCYSCNCDVIRLTSEFVCGNNLFVCPDKRLFFCVGSALNFSAISLSLLLLPWVGSDNPPLMLPKARSPLENSVTCLSGHISMEDLQSQTSASMDWLSKFTQPAFTLQTPAQFHLE